MAPRRRLNHLPPPRENAKRRVLRVKLPSPFRLFRSNRKPEISLRPSHHPLQRRYRSPRRRRPSPRQISLASILDPTASTILHLYFKLQIEVLGFEPVEGDIAVGQRLLLG